MQPRTRAWLIVVASLFARTAGASDGGIASGELRGSFSPKEAMVRVARGKVELVGRARMQAGLPVGVESLDEARCTLEVKNGLMEPVRDVTVELSILREVPGGARGLGKAAPTPVDEEAGAIELPPAYPITGWKFRYGVESMAPGATVELPCRSALPPVEGSEAPPSLAELTFAVDVVSYRAPGLPLSQALEMVRHGADADQRAAIVGYGDGLGEEARARDEQLLSAALGDVAGPAARGGRPSPPRAAPAPGDTAPAALHFALLLSAARRIGGASTLETLLVLEEPIAEHAPALPERKDDGRPPPPNADLLPADFADAVHETLVEVAHHNLARLYSILHPDPAATPSPESAAAAAPVAGGTASTTSPPPPSPLVAAATRLADEEDLDAPESWLEAAAATGDRSGRDGVALIKAMGRAGGPEVVAAFSRVLAGSDETLRRAASVELAARGEDGIGRLVDALDTEDEARKKAPASALRGLEGAGFEILARLCRARGVPVPEGATASAAIVALDDHYVELRRRAVEETLTRAEQADPLSRRPEELCAEARRRSPVAYAAARERLALIAAQVYRARAIAHRADARVLLDEVRALGPVQSELFRSALRDARIAQARDLADRDLDGALRLLRDRAADGPPDDAVLADIARSLILTRLDEALDRREPRTADLLLARARRYGTLEQVLAPRERRLRMLRLALPLGLAGIVLLLGVTASIPLVLRRKRSP